MKILRYVFATILVFAVIFTFVWGKNLIKREKSYFLENNDKTIITLWHIEKFEGGQGSRKQFLLDTATKFEKINKNFLVMVVSHTQSSAEESIKEGVTPDLISYGTGFNCTGFSRLEIDKKFYGGMIGKDCYALPWCKGGYVLIYNKNLVKNDGFIDKDGAEIENVVVSSGGILPLLALSQSKISASQFELLSPLEAYVKFLQGKTPYFLGTQRDVVRIMQRGVEVGVKVLDGYNDLYQYISLCSKDTLKSVYAEKFIEYLLSESVQKQLNKICMYSEFYEVEYDNEMQRELQKCVGKSGISAFSSNELIEELEEKSLKIASGNKNDENKIQNVLIKP